MNEELTPLQAFNKIDVDTKNNYVDEFIIIQKALKDYEHSQQQRELYFKQAKELKELYKEELKNVSYYNNLALKYKKALEIIKEKKWLVEDILNAFIEDKEKCDLLKEILE